MSLYWQRLRPSPLGCVWLPPNKVISSAAIFIFVQISTDVLQLRPMQTMKNSLISEFASLLRRRTSQFRRVGNLVCNDLNLLMLWRSAVKFPVISLLTGKIWCSQHPGARDCGCQLEAGACAEQSLGSRCLRRLGDQSSHYNLEGGEAIYSRRCVDPPAPRAACPINFRSGYQKYELHALDRRPIQD